MNRLDEQNRRGVRVERDNGKLSCHSEKNKLKKNGEAGFHIRNPVSMYCAFAQVPYHRAVCFGENFPPF